MPTTYRSLRRSRGSWCRAWASRRTQPGVTTPRRGTGRTRDRNCNVGPGRAQPARPPRQHEPGPQARAALVVFFPDPVRALLPDAADLHADHLAQVERGDRGGPESLVGLRTDADQLPGAARIDRVHEVLLELGDGEIGRAHVELQSLMRISYAVFCLKKK